MNIDIKILTAKARMFIEIEEREALVGTIKFGRPAIDDEPERGGRFARTPNFAIPGTCPDRPISATGRVAMHFKHTFVVKKARYGEAGLGRGAFVLTGDSDGFETDAANHERYISREEAVMAITAASYDGYIEAGFEARDAIFTNIDPDLEKRVGFWNAVARRERNPSPDVVTFYPERLSGDQWAILADGYESGCKIGCSAKLRDMNAAVGPVELQIEFRDFTKLRKQLRRMNAWDKDRPAITIKRGRGGRVQRRMVGELPAGISSAAQVRIASRFGSWLEELGMMYTVVVHAPDHHNDKRNFHLHVAAYDRPCRYLHEHGCWDFDHRVQVEGQHNRFRAPFRQNKPGSLTRPSNGKDFKRHGSIVMSQFREKFAELCNAELRESGINRLFDHRSYSAMGIEQQPGRHLGTKAASLEAAGIPTAVGIENAENSWQGAFHRAAMKHNIRRRLRADCRAHAAVTVDRLTSLDVSPSLANELQMLVIRIDALQDELADHELELERLYLTVQMAHSRSEKTWEVCQRLLEVIEAGGGKPGERDEVDEIRARQQEARAHSDRVDDAIRDELLQAANFADRIHALAKELDGVIESSRILIDEAEGEQAARASQEVGVYFEAPLDYEEEWNNAFLRIQLNGLEIKAPTERISVFHVPGIDRTDLARLTNPIYQKRSQARLQAMFKFQGLNKARAAAKSSARNAVGTEASGHAAEKSIGFESEALAHGGLDGRYIDAAPPPLATLPSPPNRAVYMSEAVAPQSIIEPLEAPRGTAPSGVPLKPDGYYDDLTRKAREKRDADRAEAVSEWFEWLRREFEGRPFPVRFEGPNMTLDLNQLPTERRLIPDAFSTDVIKLVEREVGTLREVMRVLLLGSSRSLVQFRDGKAIYDPKDFGPSVRPHLDCLLSGDPVVRGYASEANSILARHDAAAHDQALAPRQTPNLSVGESSPIVPSSDLDEDLLLAQFQKGRGAER